MISAWTKNLNSVDDITRFQNSVLSAKSVLSRQSDILSEMYDDLNNTELSTKIYDTPNWECKQAHINGQKAMIKSIQILINLDQKDN